MRYRIELSYDGSDFCGWQSQPNGSSIQDAAEAAVEKLFGCRARVTGSGRTDAGVHAIRQVAHFDCEKDLPDKTVVGGLNSYLPRTVRVLSACKAENGFDARKSARKKTYMYLMYRGSESPLLYKRALCVGEADADAMRKAAQAVVGTHDFAAFKAAGSGAKTSVRTVYSASIDDDGKFIRFYITADGFLYNMVRIIVGQLVKAGRGGDVNMTEIIESADRTRAKETAPPYGLYLYSVDYGDE